MRNPLRPLLGWWGSALGTFGVVEDVVATIRDRRLTKADNEQLAASARNIALAKARQGCTHTPPCPPACAPDRTRAAEVWSDNACVYLCNGIVLSIKAPDFPSFDFTLPEKEATP